MRIFQQLNGILQRLFTELIIFTVKILGRRGLRPPIDFEHTIFCVKPLDKDIETTNAKLVLELWVAEGLEKELSDIIDKSFDPQ